MSTPKKRTRPTRRNVEREKNRPDDAQTDTGTCAKRKSEYQRLVDERLAEAAQLERTGLLLCATAKEIRKICGHAPASQITDGMRYYSHFEPDALLTTEDVEEMSQWLKVSGLSDEFKTTLAKKGDEQFAMSRGQTDGFHWLFVARWGWNRPPHNLLVAHGSTDARIIDAVASYYERRTAGATQGGAHD